MTAQNIDAPRVVTLRPLDHYEAKVTPWLWPGRIPAGEVTVLAGDGGLGKSTLAAWLAAKVTTGELAGLTGMRSAWVLLGEDDPARVLKLRYRAAGCDMRRVAVIASATDQNATRGDELLVLPDQFPQLAAQVARSTPELLVVDPLTAFLGGGVDAHRDGGQGGLRAVLGPLQRMAHEHGTTVLVLAHLNKGTGPAGQRIAGSAGVRNAARNVLLLVQHPDSRDAGDDDGRRLLGHEKCNGGPTTATLDVTISSAPAIGDHGKPLTLDDGTPATTSLAVVGEEADVDYRDALAAASTAPTADAPAGGRAEAEEFLREALASGPVEVRTLNAEAQVLGIADRTLKRARAALGVEASKAADGWVVSLPSQEGQRGQGTKQGHHPASGPLGPIPFPQPPKAPVGAGDSPPAGRPSEQEERQQGGQGGHPTDVGPHGPLGPLDASDPRHRGTLAAILGETEVA